MIRDERFLGANRPHDAVTDSLNTGELLAREQRQRLWPSVPLL
jgi:hypothetical protein